MISYAEQLRQVRDYLTEDNWSKSMWVGSKNNTLCMCVHGAAQKIVNPLIKDLFNRSQSPNPYAMSQCILRGSIVDSIEDAAITINNSDMRSMWLNRPNTVKINKISVIGDYGNFNLHYLMAMFGITLAFNDDPNTTLEMLKDRLTKASKWAEENEEFLNNN